MVELLLFRERIRSFFNKYDFYIIAAAKFFLALIALLLINERTGYSIRVSNPFVAVSIALVCSFLPGGVITFFICCLTLLHFAAVSIEVTILAAILFIMMFLLYFIFKPGNSYLVAVAVVLSFLQIPGSIGIVAGLAAGPLAGVPIIFALFICALIQGVSTNFSSLAGQTGSMTTVQKFIYGIDILLKDETMWVIIIALLCTICIVYWIRLLSVKYSWNMAIVAGAVIYTLTMFLPSLTLDVKMNLGLILVNVFLSILMGVIYCFFVFAVDYSRTEYVQFEDEDYYYYVKAVPKIKVSSTEVQVKHITAKTEEEGEKESSDSDLDS